jgi:hypothetical protein
MSTTSSMAGSVPGIRMGQNIQITLVGMVDRCVS